MPRKTRNPSYRYHKSRACAVVTINGKDHYLGEHDSAESWEKYHRLLAEWLADGTNPPVTANRAIPRRTPPDSTTPSLTINELILHYWRHVESYYIKDGKATSEQDTIRQALRFVRKLYGSTQAVDFGPLALKAVRQAMIEHPITRTVKVRDLLTGKAVTDSINGEQKTEVRVLRHGLARKYINDQIARIKRIFAWAVEEELLPASVHQALLRVKGLRKGKTAAREKPRVKPVRIEHVDAVLPLVSPTVRAMIEIQLLSSCRPQDVVQLRRDDIDRSGPVWEYRPKRYKTEHHDEDIDGGRVVFLGPRAQAILTPFLVANPTGYLFSPRRAEEQRQEDRRHGRRTKLWPSHQRHQARKRQARARAKLRDCYDVAAYRRAIARACQKAAIPLWHPHRLRHTRLTEIRKKYNLEASKACAGQREISVTQHYAEQDQALAHRVMAEIG